MLCIRVLWVTIPKFQSPKFNKTGWLMVYMKENLAKIARSHGDSEGITITGVLEVNDLMGALDYVVNH